ncbi:MAG: hypothetical protein SNI51_03835 [Rikenellaceae bacterium]
MKQIFITLSLVAILYSCDNGSSKLNIDSLPTTTEIKSIPLPPLNQRWVVNEQFSDEFNDGELDEQKWHRVHPTWIGREPGLFVAENVSFDDGCMVLRGDKMERDTTINGSYFNISCAAVISKKREAHYGYYECRFKANKTTLSSTFWLSTPSVTFPTEGLQPTGSESGRFRQELDICECIGRMGDFQGRFFAQGMNANMHYWFTAEDTNKVEDQRAKECRLIRPDSALLSDDFNIFGCWWRDAENASFYLNGEQESHRQFIARKSHKEPYDKPFRFTEPMTLNLVVETYPQPWIELPSDQELTDPTLSSTLYDWVRSYVLVDAWEPNDASTSAMEMFEDKIHIGSKSIAKPIMIQYTAPVDRQILLTFYDQQGRSERCETHAAPAGYANLEFDNLTFESSICYLSAALIGNNSEVISIDSFRVQ